MRLVLVSLVVKTGGHGPGLALGDAAGDALALVVFVAPGLGRRVLDDDIFEDNVLHSKIFVGATHDDAGGHLASDHGDVLEEDVLVL